MHKEWGGTNPFTKEMLEIAVRLWSCFPISLLDVRYQVIHLDESMQNYIIPTSMLVYTHGMASIKLDRIGYQSGRSGDESD